MRIQHVMLAALLCVFNLTLLNVRAGEGPNPGSILCEFYDELSGGNAVNILTNADAYPGSPTSFQFLTAFEIPAERADHFGTRVRGYVIAPESGDYTFWVASDDNSELWISTSEDPKDKKKIASVPEWTSPKEWTRFPAQKSAPVKLEKDKKYYIEALHKEGGGGDNLAVAWQLPSGAKEEPIPGKRLAPCPAPKIAPVVRVQPVLTVTSPVPSSPGVHWLKATVKYKDKEFPVAFGVFLQGEYFKSKDERFPVITTMHNVVDAVGGTDGGDGLLFEGFSLLMVKDIGADNRHSGEWPAVKFNPRLETKFIGIIPQCPKDKSFYNLPMSGVIVEQINWVEKNFRTDPDRNFLTGFSYGGTSTWYVGMQYPERFAAIIPISARIAPTPDRAPEILKDVGVWCGVGSEDGGFSDAFTKMRDIFTAAKHPNFTFSLIKSGQHLCYQSIYGDPEFWKWMNAQRRKPGAATAATNPAVK